MDGGQPARWTAEEGQRRHDHEMSGVIEAAEPGADQAHVVIEGQPAHHHVVGIGLQGPAHGADIGQQVGVGQRHALGGAGAA